MAHALQNARDLQENIIVSSEGEGRLGSQETRNSSSTRPLIFQKQFHYTSANQAKGVYKALAYPPPPIMEVENI